MSLSNQLGTVHLDEGNFPQAANTFQDALSLAFDSKESTEFINDTFSGLTEALLGSGDVENAANIYDGLVARARELDIPEFLSGALQGLGDCYIHLKKIDVAEKLFLEALTYQRDDTLKLRILYTLSMIQFDSMKTEMGKKYIEECLEIARSRSSEFLPSILYNYGRSLLKLEPKSANLIFEEALDAAKRFGEKEITEKVTKILFELNTSSGSLDTLENLWEKHLDLKQTQRYEEAILALHEALPIAEKAKFLNNVALIYVSLADLSFLTQKGSDAESYLDQCLNLLPKLENDETIRNMSLSCASVYFEMHKWENAKNILLKYVDSPMESEQSLFCLTTLASIEFFLKQFDKSLHYYERCFDLVFVMEESDKKKTTIATIYQGIGNCHAMKREWTKALEMFEERSRIFPKDQRMREGISVVFICRENQNNSHLVDQILDGLSYMYFEHDKSMETWNHILNQTKDLNLSIFCISNIALMKSAEGKEEEALDILIHGWKQISEYLKSLSALSETNREIFSVALYHLFYLCGKLSTPLQSVDVIADLIKIEKDQYRLAYLEYNLGAKLAQAGKSLEAKPYFEKCLSYCEKQNGNESGTELKCHVFLAGVAADGKDLVLAKHHYKLARELGQHEDPAFLKLIDSLEEKHGIKE